MNQVEWDKRRRAKLDRMLAVRDRQDRHMAALRSIGFTGTWLGLRRIEARAHRYNEDSCNLDIGEVEEARRYAGIFKSVRAQFGGKLPDGFQLNGDPRGYALKLDPAKCKLPTGIQTDWGGYGILAPEEER